MKAQKDVGLSGHQHAKKGHSGQNKMFPPHRKHSHTESANAHNNAQNMSNYVGSLPETRKVGLNDHRTTPSHSKKDDLSDAFLQAWAYLYF